MTQCDLNEMKRFATVDKICPELDPLFQRQMLHTGWSELAGRNELIRHRIADGRNENCHKRSRKQL